MKKIRNTYISIFLLIICIASLSSFAQQSGNEGQTTVRQTDDESDVKQAVENFLIALGNDETEKVRSMMLPNANVASIAITDGETKIFSVTADQYLSDRESKQNRKFKEPVSQYTVNISQGMLAFVRADATVYYDGEASHRTTDFFVLMKDNGVWKLLSGSYTSLPLDKDE